MTLTVPLQFQHLGLPPFERIPGVLVQPGATFDIPRISVIGADLGCALSHREAWKRIVKSGHVWAIVHEDDCPPISYASMKEFPPIPADCDYTLLSNNTYVENVVKICGQTEILHMPSGWSTCGYIMHRSAAERLLKASENGFGMCVWNWACSDE